MAQELTVAADALQSEVGASLVGIQSIPGISATHMQAALAAVKTLLDAKVEGVQEEGVNLPYRARINVTGAGVSASDDPVNSVTVLDIPGLGDYPHVEKVEQDGVDLGYMPVLNITGGGATLTPDIENNRYDLYIEGVDEIPDATVPATTVDLGKVRLTVVADNPAYPIVVGANDPSVNNARVPLAHVHEIDDLPISDDGESNDEKVPRASDARLSNTRSPSTGSVSLPTAASDIALVYICTSTTRPINPKRGQLIYETDSNILMKQISAPSTPDWQPVGTGASTITVQEEGTTIAQRATLNVTGEGATVADDVVTLKTILDIPGVKVQVGGVDVGTHAILNLVGATAVDDAVNKRVNVSIAAGADATTEQKGSVELATLAETTTGTDATRATTPEGVKAVADTKVGTTDTRIPTQGENDALQGTDGTPSNTNRFVTNSDDRLENVTPTAIYGLALRYDSTTQVSVLRGGAWIESLERVVHTSNVITKTALVLAASTFYNVFLYVDGGGVPQVEVIAYNPASPPVFYMGSARHKFGDMSRRYLGTIRSNASNQIVPFRMAGDTVRYRDDLTASPFLVLTDGRATLETSVSCASIVPPGCTMADIAFFDKTTLTLQLASGSDFMTTGYFELRSGGNKAFVAKDFVLNDLQSFRYYYLSAPASGDGLRAQVLGYTELR